MQLNFLLTKTKNQSDTGSEFFNAAVPGTAQLDYAEYKGFADYKFADNYHQFDGLEDYFWIYKAVLPKNQRGKRTVFFCGGIDYQYEIFADKQLLYSYEGMFKPFSLDLTDNINEGCKELFIKIFPAPKRAGAGDNRQQADQCAKPAVSYGWDWHPRLITQGIWQDCCMEFLPEDYIKTCDVSYVLSDDLKQAVINILTDCKDFDAILLFKSKEAAKIENCGNAAKIIIENPKLWWPVRQGAQNRYKLILKSRGGHTIERNIGFRRVRLISQSSNHSVSTFPFTQSLPPATIEINGRQIFGKGSNFVNPDIFVGRIDKDTYEPLIRLAAHANMNLLRCWGGAIVGKEAFFELCDEYGIMVWQEFPLACNHYGDNEHYLEVLKSEAVAIVKSLRTHPCVVLWCGGNELLTGDAMMTEQFLALRLLNSICYENDRNVPYINSSPLYGMRHGHYIFRDRHYVECIERFQETKATAFTEFGCPSPSDMEYLKTFIPQEELSLENMGKSFIAHHGLQAWMKDSWLEKNIIESYFGKAENLQELIENGKMLSRVGYKSMFEEARRQKPHCAMALNWCFNESWPCAANNSLINYPAIAKNNYYHVKESLKDTVFSARLKKFAYIESEMLISELFLLNDTISDQDAVNVEVFLEIDGKRELLLRHKTQKIPANQNLQLPSFCVQLPKVNGFKIIKIILNCIEKKDFNNEYEIIVYDQKIAVDRMKIKRNY